MYVIVYLHINPIQADTKHEGGDHMSGCKPTCALITGASLGLGRALVHECAARGMRLVLVALPGSGLPELGAQIARDRGVTVDWLEADLTESATLDSLAAMIRSKGLEIDLLINNAGVGSVGAFKDSGPESHEATINLNILALVRLTRLLLPELEARKRGRILNVASLGSFYPMPTLSVYSATKSFVLEFSLALREELAGSVMVSVLCPNTIRTTNAVNEYVDRLGLLPRLACLTPERIARVALDGVIHGTAVIIPGFFNRTLAAVSRLMPRALIMRIIRRYWGGFGASAEKGARMLAEPDEA
jgi:short-subunit dehydrogenase